MKDSPLRELGNIKEQYELSRTLKQLGARVEYWDEDPDCGPGTLDDVEELLSEAEIDFMAQLFPNIFPYGDEPDLEKALGCYRSAIDTAPSPAVQAEIAYLLLRRAKVDPLPLSEFDFEDSRAELHDAHYSSPLALPPEGRSRLIGLALDAYGRIYARNVHWLGCDHPEGIVNPWLQLLVMDGLRVIFQEMDRPDLTELTCHIYDAWTQAMDWHFYDNSDAWRFERRFAETRGVIQGRLMRDPANRKAAAERLAAKLEDTWQHVDRLRLTREYLINAEILFEQLDRKGDWSSAVNEYSKAVESLFRHHVGRYLDTNPRATLSLFLRDAIDYARGKKTKKFSNVSLSTFKDALQMRPERLPQTLRRMRDDLNSVVRSRGRATHAAHAAEPWKISREEAERVSESCLRLIRALTKLGLDESEA